jgi:hypothetical protein
MSIVISAEGQVTDKELVDLAMEIAAKVNNLFKVKTDWTVEQRAAAAFHLQGFISGEVTRLIMEALIKKQQEQQLEKHPTLKPVPKLID